MSRDYKNQLLSLLLEWYESSPAYIRGEPPSRRRIMRLYENGSTDFPAYNIENHVMRKDINQAVLELAESGLIGYEWMRGQKGHIIAQIWLCPEKLTEAYISINRQQKDMQVDEVIAQLEEILQLSSEQWAKEWARDKIEEITRKRSIGNSLPEDISERSELIRAIKSLSLQSEVETLERVFSIRLFGDSKRFERVIRSRLIRILKKYIVQEDDCTDETALRLVGLVRAPEQFEFSGSLTLTLPDGEIDFSLFPHGGTISSEDVATGDFRCGTDIKRVISIENKSNYIDYVRKNQSQDELVLYHGGQYSPAKRVFLHKLFAALPKGYTFFHWGDIDFGGFSMLARLRREIFHGVLPCKMGISELEEYSGYCMSFKKSYADRLSTLLSVPELSDCVDCIRYMLQNCVRLEQEAMLT